MTLLTSRLALVAAALCLAATEAQAQIVPSGAIWSYLDDGSNQGNAWTQPAFDSSGWATGRAQLGYGDGDESTVVSFGGNTNAKHITTYFRRTFQIANPGAVPVLRVRLLDDDGSMVHVNGVEALRNNLPVGPIGHTTLAVDAQSSSVESLWANYLIDPGLLVAGTNVLCVEIHQSGPTSSDISFDLELFDTLPDDLARGPYLQMAAHDRMTIRWSTSLSSTSRVRFGATVGALTNTVDDPTVTFDHEVTLTGLTPDTRYYYAIGDLGIDLAGDDADHWFETAPLPGSSHPTRVWLLGDCGTHNPDQKAVRDAFLTFASATPADMLLLLGDNAYPAGTQEQYQSAIFDTYGETLRTTPVWSTRGNHETQPSIYYGNFTFPSGGELGGFASGTEAYYSFDRANVHFVCLDSQGSDLTPTGPMATWLAADLASTLQPWIVAYWHHPPYTKGSHDSDGTSPTSQLMVDMRANFLPILEDGGVDLVFSGHSHAYERSFLIDGHYGYSPTFSAATHVVDGGDGSVLGDGAYTKSTAGHDGAVYTVAGSSGKTTSGPLDHPVMLVNELTLGSVVLDVDDDRIDVRFIDATGAVLDHYTVLEADPSPQLSATTLTAGQGALFSVANLLPGEGAVIGYSVWGGGPSPSAFGPLALTPPTLLLSAGIADGSGAYNYSTGVPLGTAGIDVWFQALVIESSGAGLLTNGLALTVL